MRILRLLSLLLFTVTSLLPCLTVHAVTSFAAPAFQTQWLQSEAIIPNVWGPLATAHDGQIEPYKEATDGQRLVQYFDKGRMELGIGTVTSGLLATELITGQMQFGDATFQHSDPPAIPIAGDPDTAGPTYAQLASTAQELLAAATQRTGGATQSAVSAAGNLSANTSGATSAATFTIFDAITKHNVPRAFANYRAKVGLASIGNAISEPFLATVKVAGQQKEVMIQVFERRVLTYTAANSPTFQVEMGNIGQHYYQWRYGASRMAPPTAPTYGNVLWRGDYETGDLSQWASVQTGGTAGNSSIQVVTSPVRQGRYAARFTLNGTGTTRNVRAEISASQAATGGTDGQAWYYSWAMYVPSTPNATTGWNADWNLITQWSPMHFASLVNCSPPIELDIKPLAGVPHLVFIRNDQPFAGNRCGTSTTSGSYDLGPLVYDQWIDLTIHVKYATNATAGYVEGWVNSVKMLPLTAMRTEYQAAGSYLEQDIYRPDFTGVNVIYFDSMIRHDAFFPSPAS